MPEPRPHLRWLLARSRRKARRRHAQETYLIVGALDRLSRAEGVVLDPWQRRLLALSMRGERSHG